MWLFNRTLRLHFFGKRHFWNFFLFIIFINIPYKQNFNLAHLLNFHSFVLKKINLKGLTKNEVKHFCIKIRSRMKFIYQGKERKHVSIRPELIKTKLDHALFKTGRCRLLMNVYIIITLSR